MGYVYRISFPQEQEHIAYALTYLGVQEIRKLVEKMEAVLYGAN